MPRRYITFRCSDTQLARIEQAMRELKQANRTAFINQALEEFLDYAEQEEIKRLDLFALVDRQDSFTPSRPFHAEV